MSNILDILDETTTPSYLTEEELYALPVNENYAKNQLKKQQELEAKKLQDLKKV